MNTTFEVEDEDDGTCLTAIADTEYDGIDITLIGSDISHGAIDKHLFYAFCKEVVTYYESKGLK